MCGVKKSVNVMRIRIYMIDSFKNMEMPYDLYCGMSQLIHYLGMSQLVSFNHF